MEATVNNPYAAPRTDGYFDRDRHRESGIRGEQRPRSATVFGALGVVLGGFNVLFIPFLFVNRPDQMRIFAQMGYHPAYVYGIQVAIPILSIALLILGVGLLRVRMWARNAFPWYAIATIAVQGLSCVYATTNLLQGVAPEDPIMRYCMIGQVAGGVLWLVFAGVGFAIFTRRRNREVFIAYHAYNG
ncbi:MAG: hypothetical protein PF961_10085 [Planctomycetota bacterium]|jgi:hypothetical protein|nr:hypothetical protein [Planctomycetota bacterium]